ncbi:hypothetical protein BGX21_004451 [Mortierella sp. AD011]|nr:hypothetical protein BGX20_009071 [Mortierella sp. AD010]KAF9403409.1 hypothetical protein BGX21_004451 [Mortierella sp. AD011]
MSQKSLLAVYHKATLSVGGIVRYRIKIPPSQARNIEALHFCIRNSSPAYRNITPASGPWKISVALIKNPNRLPVVPELVPSIGCAQVCRLDAKVNSGDDDSDDNEWELEVLSEMVLKPNWIDIKVEVYATLRQDISSEQIDKLSNGALPSTDRNGTDAEATPQILLPSLVSCEYKDTAAICGPIFPDHNQNESKEDEDGLHLVVLTHGIHGTWLDMLYLKEQIDAQNAHNGKTVTLLTDTNHAGTEEGIQMAGQRVALDILEFTGYYDTEEGKELWRSLSTVAKKKSRAKSPGETKSDQESPSTSSSSSSSSSTAAKNRSAKSTFPRGFSKVSIIGHSLGGLINIYALGYIEEVTKGAFFQTIQPAHFITVATPLLGVGFEHPWVLGVALSLGCIGQTGKDLALEDRSSKLKRSSPASPSSVSPSPSPSPSSSSSPPSKHKSKESKESVPDCSLDRDPEPLLLAMSRPSSVSNRVLKQFKDRTSYANIENDMAVRFNTSTMMGIPKFDIDHFFSPEGAATHSRKNLYQSALASTLALLFPKTPTKEKFLNIADAPSPIVIVSHVDPGSLDMEEGEEQGLKTKDAKGTSKGSKKEKRKSRSADAVKSIKSSSSRSPSSSSRDPSSGEVSSDESSSSAAIASRSRAELAVLVAEGYHTDMDWTKIGVLIEHEAHVQIIVRRKWYNLDGWKCIKDLVERFDFN